MVLALILAAISVTPAYTNVNRASGSKIMTNIEQWAPAIENEISEIEGVNQETVTNISSRVTSNVVTKAYVESLGIESEAKNVTDLSYYTNKIEQVRQWKPSANPRFVDWTFVPTVGNSVGFLKKGNISLAEYRSPKPRVNYVRLYNVIDDSYQPYPYEFTNVLVTVTNRIYAGKIALTNDLQSLDNVYAKKTGGVTTQGTIGKQIRFGSFYAWGVDYADEALHAVRSDYSTKCDISDRIEIDNGTTTKKTLRFETEYEFVSTNINLIVTNHKTHVSKRIAFKEDVDELFSTNNTALVSVVTNLAPSKARGISLSDPVRHCNWYQAVTNGVFFWAVED